MFTQKRYNHYKALESFTKTIELRLDDRIRACNYILSFDPLYRFAEWLYLTNNLKELLVSHMVKIDDEMKVLICLAYNLKSGHVFEEMSINLAELHLLSKDAFETVLTALKISKHGIPEKELIKYTNSFEIVSKGNYYKLSDISMEEAISMAKEIPGYLRGTLERLNKWTSIKNLQEIDNELKGQGFSRYRNIGKARCDLLEEFISKVKKELLK